MAKGELGFGLESLFDDNSAEVQVKRTLRISEIEPNRDQPRKFFSDEGIEALADSIREHGVLQPILVRPLPNGSYQIVAGERRWRASRMAGLDEVPVNIKELDDFQTMQIAMAENLQRENLNPIEEAEGYKYLIDNFNMSKEQIAKIAGKSRSYISNSIRILSLPDFIIDALRDGKITSGHAKALLMFDDEKRMLETAEKAINGNLSVRQIEKLAKQSESSSKSGKPSKNSDSYFTEMEISLREHLGRKVKVDYSKNKGVLILEFYDKNDLSAIADKLVDNIK
ncbi:MAG: ParB/RepB/Spo0J family partition protein [Ruminococcus sp.]|nr:ParB/RepB/Spo0J family partition protein [Oscillospiraceae bacterium]MDY4413671.1 ParB/RepB/Spo0J family partition protein [Ruminococcus sp.]